MVCPIVSMFNLPASCPRFSGGSLANTLEALPCVLPLAAGNCPAIGYCSVFHIPITKLLENAHFEVRTPEVVWAPPTASSVKTFARTKIGMDLQIPEASSFSQFMVCLFKSLDFGANPRNGGFSVKVLLWRKFSTVWGSGMWKLKGGEMLESVRHSSSGGKRRLYLLWVDCWCGTNSQKEYSSIESVVFLNKLISEDQIKSWSPPWLNVNWVFQHMSHYCPTPSCETHAICVWGKKTVSNQIIL